MVALGVSVEFKTHVIVDSDGIEHELCAKGVCKECGKRVHPLGNRSFYSADIAIIHWRGSKMGTIIGMYGEPREKGIERILRWYEGISYEEKIPPRVEEQFNRITGLFKRKMKSSSKT